VLVRSSSVRPVLESLDRALLDLAAEKRKRQALERELRGLRSSSGRALEDLSSDLVRHTRAVVARSDRAIR
jgi:hypothetical protein